MNLDRLATTIEHDRRAAHEERNRAATAPQPAADPRSQPPFADPAAPSR